MSEEPGKMKARIVFAAAIAALMIYAGYAALFVAPDEATMHEIQRIFYFHVASWMAMFLAFTIVFCANVAYLLSLKEKWDALGVAGAELGVICCTIGLITGPLWAKPAWGIWWTWDARLTTTFLLWLLYVSYLVLRGLLEDPARKAMLTACFGILAYLDVPLVYFSNRLWRTQHPQPVILGGANSGLDPKMGRVLLICGIALTALTMCTLRDRYLLERLRAEAGDLRMELESRESD
jgi:heme exporter protein C